MSRHCELELELGAQKRNKNETKPGVLLAWGVRVCVEVEVEGITRLSPDCHMRCERAYGAGGDLARVLLQAGTVQHEAAAELWRAC